MNLNIDNKENIELNNKIIEKFYYYKCENCERSFYSNTKINNDIKFCIIDCRASWYIKKYKNDVSCIEILNKELKSML